MTDALPLSKGMTQAHIVRQGSVPYVTWSDTGISRSLAEPSSCSGWRLVCVLLYNDSAQYVQLAYRNLGITKILLMRRARKSRNFWILNILFRY